MVKKIIISFTFCLLGLFSTGFSQEINFGQYATEGIMLTNIGSNSTLDFGTLLAGEGLVQVQLTDPEVVVFSIEAEYDKDVFVTITAPPSLDLNPGNTLPFTLGAAYANQGNDNIAQARLISGGVARFPVLARGNQPPGPPPTPQHKGYTTPTATAYLYIYGSVSVGAVWAGLYTGQIDIIVSYE